MIIFSESQAKTFSALLGSVLARHSDCHFDMQNLLGQTAILGNCKDYEHLITTIGTRPVSITEFTGSTSGVVWLKEVERTLGSPLSWEAKCDVDTFLTSLPLSMLPVIDIPSDFLWEDPADPMPSLRSTIQRSKEYLLLNTLNTGCRGKPDRWWNETAFETLCDGRQLDDFQRDSIKAITQRYQELCGDNVTEHLAQLRKLGAAIDFTTFPIEILRKKGIEAFGQLSNRFSKDAWLAQWKSVSLLSGTEGWDSTDFPIDRSTVVCSVTGYFAVFDGGKWTFLGMANSEVITFTELDLISHESAVIQDCKRVSSEHEKFARAAMSYVENCHGFLEEYLVGEHLDTSISLLSNSKNVLDSKVVDALQAIQLLGYHRYAGIGGQYGFDSEYVSRTYANKLPHVPMSSIALCSEDAPIYPILRSDAKRYFDLYVYPLEYAGGC